MTEYLAKFFHFNNCIIIIVVVVVAVVQRAMKAERKLKAIQRELTTQRGEKVSDIALLSPRHAFVCFYRAVARRRSSPLSSPLFSLPVSSPLFHLYPPFFLHVLLSRNTAHTTLPLLGVVGPRYLRSTRS